MDSRIAGILHLAFAALIVAVAFYISSDIAVLGGYGYAGAFLIALLSSATIIFPAPGWAIIVAMGGGYDPVLLGLAAGVGSAIGEMTGYLAGEGARSALDGRIKETARIRAFVERYGVFGIAALAFIPNPLFDVAGIIAGSLRMKWWLFLVSCAAGRVLRYVLLAAIGAFTLDLLQ